MVKSHKVVFWKLKKQIIFNFKVFFGGISQMKISYNKCLIYDFSKQYNSIVNVILKFYQFNRRLFSLKLEAWNLKLESRTTHGWIDKISNHFHYIIILFWKIIYEIFICFFNIKKTTFWDLTNFKISIESVKVYIYTYFIS